MTRREILRGNIGISGVLNRALRYNLAFYIRLKNLDIDH
ncbi:hypothetical protein BN137_419 [Cronobacter condimenti 1330]|uniref:Uncharacterized protein n=1 Tax=Cronobacter condimenti 1330 TaxID=1073999 RepID=K8A692_9ENTR|nr:hypothetical protein BN137_419 [Cronobacter condimenti 1330]